MDGNQRTAVTIIAIIASLAFLLTATILTFEYSEAKMGMENGYDQVVQTSGHVVWQKRNKDLEK